MVMTRDDLRSPAFEMAAPSAPTAVLVVMGLALGPAVALGFARFSYALLLPAMREDLHWTYAAAGFSNTANAFGYFLGALITAPVAARIGDKRAFAIGLAVTVAALLGSGFTDDFLLISGLRAIAGAAGAARAAAGRRRWQRGRRGCSEFILAAADLACSSLRCSSRRSSDYTVGAMAGWPWGRLGCSVWQWRGLRSYAHQRCHGV
jgi:MFS family permease